VLLDQKRTKRMVRIVSLVCAIAFVGVLPIVLGLIIWGGGGSNPANQLIEDAEAAVQRNPNDLNALVTLAAQYRSANRPSDASATIQKAVAIEPKNSDELNALVGLLSSEDQTQAVAIAETYTKDNPKDPEGWITYGVQAERAQLVLQARLAFQRALSLAPKGSPTAENARVALERLKNVPITPVEPLPTTPQEPVTP
jgi:uncharacterized protein HemY